MGRTAVSKLDRANFLDKEAQKLTKKDPESKRELQDLARQERTRAIKQLKTRPKRKKKTIPGM